MVRDETSHRKAYDDIICSNEDIDNEEDIERVDRFDYEVGDGNCSNVEDGDSHLDLEENDCEWGQLIEVV